MTAVRSLSLALVASLSLATSARAGTEPGNPFLEPAICGDMAVEGSLAPVDVFAASPHCQGLCKKTVGECKIFVRKIVGCWSNIYRVAAEFQSRNCADVYSSSPAQAKSCKAIVSTNLRSLEQIFASKREGRESDCDAWGSDCIAACP
jgi:hypothetical protein